MGPCVIEICTYIRDALIHLQDTSTYATITEDAVAEICDDLCRKIITWTVEGRKNKTISDDKIKFIRKNSERNRKDPCEYFYLLYKVHKPRKLGAPVPTRHVCSDCDGITNPIGKWVDVESQPVAQSMRTYIKDSFEFKNTLRTRTPEPACAIIYL